MDSNELDFVLVNEDDITGSDRSGLQPLPTELISKIRAWLQPTDYSAQSSEYNRHLSSHVSGTTEWTQQPQYQQWISSEDQGALWVKAIAGAGKSVAAAYLAYKLQEAKNVPVLYFFFRQIIESNRTPISLLRDWMAQLLDFSPFLQWELKKYLDPVRSLDSIAFDELWQHFENAICNLQRVYCFADALDEMSSGNNWFVEKLARLGQLKSASVKVLMTSRPLPQIEDSMRHESILKIYLSKKLVDQDIIIYAEHRLHESKLPQAVWQEAQESLISKSQGSFLYTKLTIDDLLNSTRHDLSDAASIRKALDDMPTGLAEKYTSMLHDHSARSGVPQSLQLLILRWVTHSNRPLRLLEIAAMLDSVSQRDGCLSLSSPDTNQPYSNTKAVIRAACGPLIEILDDETVGVIHHSFTEFLTNGSRTSIIHGEALSFPKITFEESHFRMALACLDYLSFTWGGLDDDNEDESSRDESLWDQMLEPIRYYDPAVYVQYPFLKYARDYWAYHSAQCATPNDELFQTLDRFLIRNPKAFASCWQLKGMFPGRENHRARLQGRFPLHVAAQEGLTCYLEHLIRSGQDPKAKDETFSTPMHHAARSQCVSVTQLLLAHGTDADLDDEYGMKPLHIAASTNNASIVKALLEAGVNPHTPKTRETPGMFCGNAPRTKGNTPVKYAFQYGHLEAALAFIPFLNTEAISAAVTLAAEAGKTSIVLAVLDLVAVDINKLRSGQTLLSLAAYRHEPRLIKRLLDLGADPFILTSHNFQDHSTTPLHAMANGRPDKKDDPKSTSDSLRLLLDSGCDIEAVDAKGRTPLHLAVASHDYEHTYGEPHTAFALLENGANVSATTTEGFQPLHLARNNSSQLIQALCEHGADVNAITPQDGKTALHYALKVYSQTKFVALVDCGADCSIADCSGDTPLHLACEQYSHKVDLRVKLLLDNGANPNVKNKAGMTPLHNLGSRGFSRELRKTLKHLLSADVDLESRMRCGKTFFLEVVSHSSDATQREFTSLLEAGGKQNYITLLLEAGCEQHVHDHKGQNVLHHLLTRNIEVIPNFISLTQLAGLNPWAVDHDGNTLLHVCARHRCHSGYENLVKFLLEWGFAIEQQNYRGQTAFFVGAAISQPTFTEDQGLLDFLSDAQGRSVINTADLCGVHPIHLGAIFGEQRTRWLLNKGADAFALTDDGQSALHVAARARQSNIVGFLVDFFISRNRVDFIDHRNRYGRTALHYACRSGRIESVQILLDSGGANINILDSKGLCPLDVCAEFSKHNFLGARGGQIDAADVVCEDDYCTRPQTNNKSLYGDLGFDEDDSLGIRYIIKLLIVRGANISDSEHRPPRFMQYENWHLDSARNAGSTILIEELLTAIPKDDSHIRTETFLGILGNVHPYSTPVHALYLDHYHCIRSKSSRELLDGLIEPQKSNLRLWRCLLRLEDTRGIERFLECSKSLFVYDHNYYDSPLSTLVKYGYAHVLRKVDLAWSNIVLPPEMPVDQREKERSISANRLLLAACERDLPNLEVLKVLLENGKFDLNFVVEERDKARLGETVLHKLARSSQWWKLKAIEYLVKMGAKIDHQTALGLTPLHVAIKHGSEGAVEVLLRNGANPNVLPLDSLSCLNRISTREQHYTSRSRDSKIAHLLLDHGASPVLGKSFLSNAVEAKDISLVTRILQSHADRSHQCELSATDLFHALRSAGSAQFNTTESRPEIISIIRALLHASHQSFAATEDGMSVLRHICESGGIIGPFLELPDMNIEARDSDGRTLLLAACSHRNHTYYKDLRDTKQESEKPPTLVEQLAAQGANIKAVDNNSRNALHHLFRDGLEKSWFYSPWFVRRNIEFFLSHPSGAALVTQRDSSGMTPLHHALQARNFTSVEKLLSLGSDPLAIDNAGNSVLHLTTPRLATDSPKLTTADTPFQVFTHFLSLNVPVNALNDRGESPLFLYLQQRNSCVTHLPFFMDAGADFFTRDKRGQSLLHVVAASTKCMDFFVKTAIEKFEYLLSKDVDVTWEDEGQRTALDVAAGMENTAILGLFGRKE